MHWQMIVLFFIIPTVTMLLPAIALMVKDWSYVLSQILQVLTALIEGAFYTLFTTGVCIFLFFTVKQFWTWIFTMYHIL